MCERDVRPVLGQQQYCARLVGCEPVVSMTHSTSSADPVAKSLDQMFRPLDLVVSFVQTIIAGLCYRKRLG